MAQSDGEKRMKRTGKWFLYLAVFCMVAGTACFYAAQEKPRAAPVQKGVLDLTGRDLAKEGTIKLDGFWEMYWGRLVRSGGAAAPTGYFRVPGTWKGSLNGTRLQAKGAATYHLRVRLRPSNMLYGLRIANIQMSSAVYVNGVKRGGSGTPAPDRASYAPENRPYTVYFSAENGIADIFIQTANFDYFRGGIPYSIEFGSGESIRRLDAGSDAVDLSVIVAMLMLGIYHLGFFLLRREEKGLLCFGLYCIVSAVAIGSLGNKVFMQIFHGLPFEASYRIQNGAIFLSMLLLALFIRSELSAVIRNWLTNAILIVFGTFGVFEMLTPFRIYSRFSFYYTSGLELVAYAAIIGMLAVSYHRGRFGGYSERSLLLLILAFCGLLLCIADNTLYLLSLTTGNYPGTAGMVLFVILVSLILLHRFAEAYKTIESMSGRLKEADRRKDEFLANTSHEFRTPLNGIINISRSLLEETSGPVNERQKYQLSLVLSIAGRLSTLIRDILDLESIRRNELTLNLGAVDVKTVVSVTLDVFRYLIDGKKVRLADRIPDDLPLVRADENRLRQVIYNLVGNAVKYTERGTITLSARREGGRIRVEVEDTGIGIPEDQWETIFESFGKGRSPGGEESTGLGLSITRQLLALMDGTIRVAASKPGAGTRIVFTLPVAPDSPAGTRRSDAALRPPAGADWPAAGADWPAAAGEAAAGEWPAETCGFVILAVDDEPSNLQVLVQLFAGMRITVRTAASGEEAIAKIRSDRDIDLVLLDVMMPRMSGYEVCRKVRESHALYDLPIILLTARSGPDELAAGLEAGANDFIPKPFESLEVRARVKNLLLLKKSVGDALRAEMAFLQSQIKPHFLFNALNAILSICYTDSARAAELIGHFSRYLRRSFDIRGTETFVPLADELELVRAYAEIEKARFGSRLAVEYDIGEGLDELPIPPLTIQPLVENAIRHGLMRKEEGGRVRITVREQAGRVTVKVWDNGVGLPSRPSRLLSGRADEAGRPGLPRGSGRGVGLPNIDRRLRKLYGEGLRLESRKGGWTRVSFGFVRGQSLPQANTGRD